MDEDVGRGSAKGVKQIQGTANTEKGVQNTWYLQDTVRGESSRCSPHTRITMFSIPIRIPTHTAIALKMKIGVRFVFAGAK